MSTTPAGTTDAAPVPAGRADPLAVATTGLLLLVAGAVLVVALLALTGADEPSTLADPGPATTTGLPLLRYLQDLLGLLVVGCATVAALASGDARDLRARARAAVLPLALGWGAVTAVVYQLTASDLSGRPLPLVLTGPVQQAFVGLPQARAQLLVLLAAVLVAVASRLAVTSRGPGAAVLLLVAAAGLLPPAFVGHSGTAEYHELAVASVSLHLVAGAMWVGGLAVLAVLVLGGRGPAGADDVVVVRAFSTLALGCVVVIGASGVLNGSLRVDEPGQLTGTAYGLLLLAKAALLVVLVGFGARHRRRSVVDLARTGARAAFARLAVAELGVMVLVVALAVVLARTPPPGA